MTTIYLIRHAETDTVGKTIAGWLPDIHLNRVGITQSERLAERLALVRLVAIYSSPLERAMETARALARRQSLPIFERRNLGEIHFGDWTGRTIAALDNESEWRRFNSFRSTTRAPRGEMMLEVQVRIVTELTELQRERRDEVIAVVSHGDVIRAAVAHYAGIHLDLIQRFEISPASITVLGLSDETAVVLRLNDTEELPGSAL